MLYWEANFIGNIDLFLKCVQQRLQDIDQQQCIRDIQDSQMYSVYSGFKSAIYFESYLCKIVNFKYRQVLSKFRLRSFNLKVVTGKYENIALENRICECCNQNQVEDEYHVLFKCTLYSDLREQYLLNVDYTLHNLHNFNTIMSEKEDVGKMYQLGRFVYHAMTKRKQALMIIV